MNPSTRTRAALGVGVILVAIAAFFLFHRRTPPTTPAAATTARTGEDRRAGWWSGVAEPSRLARIEGFARGRAEGLPRLTLRGRVVDASDRPVAGAEVRLAVPPKSVVSGDDGSFAFESLTPGRYAVEARAASSAAGPITVHLVADGKPALLRLYRALTAEVLVVSAAGGKPIEGADVWLRMLSMYEPAGNQHARTGADGKAIFRGVQLIGHELSVSARGYAAYLRGPHFDDREGDLWRTRVELAPGDGVEGMVVDESGMPVAGAVVEALPYNQQHDAPPVDDSVQVKQIGTVDPHTVRKRRVGPVTGADGKFFLALGTDDKWWVLVASHGELTSAASEPIMLSGKKKTHAITLTLQSGATAAGWVVTTDDEPAAGAMVEVRWQTSSSFLEKTVQADGRGHFSISGLPNAPMLLVPASEGGTGHPVSVDFTRPLPAHGSLVLTLDNTGVIRGNVVDARRRPVPDAIINYLEMKDGEESPAVLPAVENGDDQGHFTIRGLKSGALYHISAVRPQNGDFVVREAWVRARAGEDLTLRIADEGSIVGRVVIDKGRSPAGLRVVDPATSASTVVAASGKFRMTGLPPTHYNLRISGSGVADAFVHNVIVEEGKETDVGDVQVRAGRALAGVVVSSPLGVGVDGATVRVVVDGQYRLQTISGSDGRFRFSVPSASKLVLSAVHKSGDSKQVPLDGSNPPENVRLALEVGGTIRGSVMASGKPMEGMPVVIYRSGPRPAEPTRFVQVDAAGTYRIEHVPPGKYDVELMWPAENPSDLRVYYKSASVESGQAVDVSFDGSAGPSAGTRPPLPAERDLPIYENEGEGG